jgi:adenylate cyclase
MPACFVTPLGLATGMTWKYRIARQQREYIRNAFIKFVPKEVVDELVRNAGNVGATRESLECACVATDAANFTSLAEVMQSEDLADFLNRYFDMLFRPVARHGGFVSDIVGDAMLAIWPNRSPDTRGHMLSALLEMREAARLFNEQPTSIGLTTRFGVDWGRVTLTMVGSQTHYEYRAVGDTVNTATRIQELNKKLGTRVLVSAPALEGVENFLLRDVGHFLLRGKAVPVHAFELIGPRDAADPADLEMSERFAGALALLRNGATAEALGAFRNLAADFPGDGPVAFYVRALESGTLLCGGAMKVD